MILTVTPNPALDLTWHIDRLRPHTTHRADAALARAGGKGLNVARVAAQQGLDVVAVTTAGGPVGAEFAAELVASGLPHLLVPVAGATRRTAAFVDAATGDATIVNERGVNPTAAEWDALLRTVRDELHRVTVLVVSGSIPAGAPSTFVSALVCLAREYGIPSVVDVSGPGLLRAADAGADVLKPNRQELAEATGIEDPIAASRSLLRRGARLVLASLGSEGMLAVTPDAAWHARLPERLAGNPTGAGDAAVAAVAAHLHRANRDPQSILRTAVAWSAAAVLMPAAGEISPLHPDLRRRVVVEAADRQDSA
ncbi:1-phosphofructokinase family hexose kinase [Leifsonia shinshuensis]|uniref:1-phosphofructokinase family hexose kinase n=1 Tax=Leifsonia shinshuensis TaxID=150026 RepID=A0A7G6YBH7_9MICO|nr:1-phosphofructokinase family hexose kinase [Leifsonia shinshuensis]QNE35842.1 1-phosphofructokinase family hexose kinase [Leifsonia shinshuensis]